jgi:hypothetical protein
MQNHSVAAASATHVIRLDSQNGAPVNNLNQIPKILGDTS